MNIIYICLCLCVYLSEMILKGGDTRQKKTASTIAALRPSQLLGEFHPNPNITGI